MMLLRQESDLLDLPASEAFLERCNRQTIAAYREKPLLVEEHVRQEAAIREGAYSRRQVYELVQNAVDALQGTQDGRIHVLLTDSALYCADNGSGLTNRGMTAILNSYLSPKHRDEIGRYGLGFKSLLAVTDRAEVYTDSISFRFDPEWARGQIRSATGYTGACPVLRLARSVNRDQELQGDSHLMEIAAWARTIVKVPLTERAPWLENDILDFPAQLLLFAPQIGKLILEDRKAGVRRVFECEHGEVCRLTGDRETVEWRVFDTEITLPENIRRDGGIFAGRETVTLSWAVPAKGGPSDGRFWAFFPLERENMSLKGILNAPWKLNDDRSNILQGHFTDYVLERAIELVFQNLPKLVDKQDPGKLLEVYPARFEERRGTDLALTHQFYRQAGFMPSVPDTSGALQKVTVLNLHPRDLTPEAIKEWWHAPDMPIHWAHVSCAKTTIRQARIDQLRPEDHPRATVKEWLEVLAGSTQDGLTSEIRACRSAHAIRAASDLIQGASREIVDQVRASRIVLTEGFEYVPADPNQVFLPNPDSEPGISLPIVHDTLMEQMDVVYALQQLGISVVDASSELRSFIHSRGIHHLMDDDWIRVWRIVDRIETKGGGDAASVLIDLCGDHFTPLDIRVRTMAGTYRRISEVLLPDAIVEADRTGPDREFTVDVDFHANHLSVIRGLGAVAEPSPMTGAPTDEWYERYYRYCVDLFIRNLRESGVKSTPRDNLIAFEQDEIPSPLGLLIGLSPSARARMSRSLLRWMEPRTWTMAHKTNQTYPCAEVPSPVRWMLERYGYLETSIGPRPINECVGPGLSRFKTLLPVADCSESEAQLLGLPNDIDQLSESLVSSVLQSDVDPSLELVSFWATVCDRHQAPSELNARVGSSYRKIRPDQLAAVSDDPDALTILEKLGIPYVVAANKADADRLRKHWRLKDPTALVERNVYYEPAGESIPLLNLFPALQLYVGQDLDPLSVIPCRVLEITYRAGREVRPVHITEMRDGDRLLLLMGPGDEINLYDEETLNRVLSLIDEQLDPSARAMVLSALERSVYEHRLREVAQETDPAGKLLAAVGADALRETLPDEILQSTATNDLAVARRAHSVHGVESLIVLKDALRAAGFHVPGTWAGSFEARRFVRQLGFPEQYAGFPTSDRPSSLDVPAPVNLPQLHDYQERLVEGILKLLDSTTGPRRGLMSLPTGAGKTRVTVEALIRAINSGLIGGPILWIAQTEELCEQAVQSWAEIWTAKGACGTLRINRLWSTREADEYRDGSQVVVATRHKLEAVREKTEYMWLSEPAMVVVDEAHESTTPTYTRTLEWLGLHRRHTRCPLLGLSATPFKGNEEETRRLAFRYGQNRIDAGLFDGDPYKELQRMGILSLVDHEILEGVQIPLTEQELVDFERFDQLPQKTVRELSLHKRRNRQIIESIRSKSASWNILVFALSVNHAKLLAAELGENGIPAAAISSQTAPGARRYYIERFKAGDIRVLTNYGVLTTGFDAPKVEAIYVVRPVFSPARYQQMIGRGLRGPLNGGTERCLIVNVADTFERFGLDLAFREFEYLWSQ